MKNNPVSALKVSAVFKTKQLASSFVKPDIHKLIVFPASAGPVVTFLKQNQNVLLYAIYGDEGFLVNLLNVVLLPPSTIAKIHLVRQGSGLDDKPLPQAQISVNPKWL
jgi:hypothetical protein